MKTLRLLYILMIISYVPAFGQMDTIRYLKSYFETSEDQLQWTSLPPDNEKKWIFQKGGKSGFNPDTAYAGIRNAFLYWSDFMPVVRNLTSDPIDLSDAKKPVLTFGQAMFTAIINTDKMKVLFKAGSSAPWDTIIKYNTAVAPWALRTINIVDYGTKYLCDNFQIAFEGTARGGHGVCLDNVIIEETDVIGRYVKTVKIKDVEHELIPSGASDIPVMRLDMKIVGNTNVLKLNSIKFTSLSAHDSLFANNGFELVATHDSIYQPILEGESLKIGSPVSISNGTITFNNLDHVLATGYNAFWLIADIKGTAPHKSMVDFKVETGSIDVNGSKYPASELSGTGSNKVEQSVFYDSFESASEWTLDSDFETAIPQGFTFTTSDPDFAYSGTKVLGTDLTVDGWYKLNISSANAYYATTPILNLLFYDDVKLSFEKWFAFDGSDHGVIEVSNDTAKTWHRIWDSRIDALSPENEWSKLVFDNEFDELAARKPWVRIRFGIIFSNNVFAYAGFNMDNFAVTGNYLTNDVGITTVIKPVDDCFNPGMDLVQLVVRNYADSPTATSIPVFFSKDGTEAGRVYETIPGPIGIGGSVTYQFTVPANFAGPGNYSDFEVGLAAAGDEDIDNNVVNHPVFIQESLSSPDYENFEVGEGYWKVYGSDPTWVCQTPDGSIPPISGSPNAWILSTFGNYLTNDTSYIESSCYDLASSPRSVFEMKLWLDSELGKDGALVEYSTDEGASWTILLDNEYSWNWNWYNGTVSALESAGWSGISDGKWKTVRQLLPSSLNTEPKVKFRVKWASDEANTFRGMAVDDVRIYPLPPDIGVTKIDSFADRCQFINPDLVTVNIKNMGTNQMYQNDSIIVAFDLDNELIDIDTFKLEVDLLPGEVVKHTFDTPIDITNAGNYNLTAYTLLEDDPWFYFANNDTVSLDFEVLPNPFTMLFDTIQTRQPDTVYLRPYYHADYEYKWHNLSTERVFDVEDAGWHIVTVTAILGNGCSTKDSTYVELLFNDTGADSLIYPVDNCGLTTKEYLTVRVRNFGTDSIASGQKIAVIYRLNNGPEVSDTLKLTGTLHSKKTIDFTFTKGPIDLSSKGFYDFKIYTSYGGDTIAINDTILSQVEIIGRPAVSLGPDISVKALSHTLDAGSGFESYYWDNGIITQTREITEPGKYWVTVLDANMCDNTDTVNIWFKIRDIRPTGLSNPVSSCTFNPAEPVSLMILNAGTDTVPAGTEITVSYRFMEGSRVSNTFNISSAILPGDNIDHPFSGTLSLNEAGDYNFETTVATDSDLKTGNDTSFITVYRYAKPVVDFGLDNAVYIEDVSLMLEAGYSPEYAYVWQDASTEHQYNVTNSGIYHVVATDNRTACFDRDTVTVFLIYSDVGVTWSDMPLNGCTGEFENITVKVQNLGPSNIGKDAPIYIACDVNGTRSTIETLVRTANFGIGASLDLVLSGNINIGSSGISKVAIYTVYDKDKKTENDTLELSFEALPSPVIDFGDESGELTTTLPHMLDAGAGHKAYYWQNGSTAQTFNATQTGTFTVTVTGQNDCQTTKSVIIKLMDGIIDFTGDPGNILIYPNPNNGLFNVSLDDKESSDLTLTIINNQGQTVYIREFKASDPDWEKIDVQHLQSGVYHVLIISEKQSFRGKMVIR